MPANKGGTKLNIARRAARELSESAKRSDFIRTARQPIVSATAASSNQAQNCFCSGIRKATIPVANAVTPMAHAAPTLERQ